jgi:hypothetical protein
MSRVAAVGLLALIAAFAQPRGAGAHGNVDQELQGGAGCNAFNFPASVVQDGGQRQEFVPSQSGLIAVDVCLLAEAGPTEVDVLVRSGTASAPGGVIGGGSTIANAAAYNHVDFAAPIPVTAGDTYVIELMTANGLAVGWLGSAPDVDLYAAGSSSAPAVVGDFAFRTYSGTLPSTSTPPATKTAAPTSTRTPASTRTASATLTSIPTQTATPAPPLVGTPTPPALIAASTPSGPSGAALSPTRVSGVLGGARRVGLIKPPDVGSGPSRTRRPLLYALSAFAAGLGALAAGGIVRAHRPLHRRQASRS